jgi:hypothetical protein
MIQLSSFLSIAETADYLNDYPDTFPPLDKNLCRTYCISLSWT